MGDSQTPASALPAWKLSFREGDRVLLRPRNPESRRVTARVVCSCACPDDFSLPVMVQVEIRIGDGEPVAVTCIPATAIERHL